ncbi:ribosomal protein S18 acetylase RimI-like enzyme [Kitasatospora sp. MAA4]|uniref:GNAT family N-acetyltransferase n=1 Tax=Kitasatospora sp. MAA4 TaxID=3035093 RepID=UPI0024739908|nr:GNAT family N-acetyltransferase [Kitasatospora sp. MAA4]MDH6135323.1 ribosomal protein S18 acetylase RimI-like enzyme [Kitasatospora sp. MAA4]
MGSSDLLIRPFRDDDAPAIAELFNRYPDAPNWVDRELDAAMVCTELAERGTVLFLVVEDGGEVLGTIGMFRSTGRRAVPDGEVVGDMFFLSPRARGGPLAGRLFSQAFRTLREQGVEAIRLTVNPANQLALPLYRQLGCVVSGPAEAGEDGNIEMVSYMPKIVTRMRRDHQHLVPTDLRTMAAWRYQVDGIAGQELGKETEEISGRTVLRTALAVGDLTFRAILDPETGEILHTAVGPDFGPDPDLPAKPVTAPEPVFEYRERNLRLTVRHLDGAIRVFHDDQIGPVLQETWPVFGPGYLTGWRHALPRELTVQGLPDGWLVSERHPHGTLHRESRLIDATLHQRTWWTGGPTPAEGLRTVLVNGLRAALLLDGSGYLPAGRGLAPIDATEFGAARTRLAPGHPVAWWDARTGLATRLRWPEGASAGLVTDSVLNLDHPADYAYRIELSQADGPDQVVPGIRPAAVTGIALRPADTTTEPLTAQPVLGSWDEREVARRPVHRLTTGSDTLLVDATAGALASWQSAGKPVLATPFPKSRAFARNPSWRGGLWVSGHGVREDENRGLGWGSTGDPTPWLFDPATGTLDSPELSWSIEAAEQGITVSVQAPIGPKDGELVVWLTPASPKSAEFLVPGGPGEVWHLSKPGAWQRWTDRVAVRLPDGRWLAVVPQGPAQEHGGAEILLRTTPAGPLLALATRHPHGLPGTAGWQLTVLADASAAEQRLRTGAEALSR